MSLKMLSVIIPSYNDEIALPLAVASANEIKYVNEIIIVDDFSSDGTENLVKKIKKNFEKIKYIKNPKNLGTGFSFLKGLENIKNPHVMLLNSDDFVLPKKVEKLFNFTIKNNLDLGYGKMAIKKNSGVHKYTHPGYKNYTYLYNERNELKDLLIFDMYIPSFGSIINYESIKDFYTNKYYEDLNHDYGDAFKAHDYDLFLNLAKRKKKIGFMNEFVCVWCGKEDSQSGLKYIQSGDACFESAFLFNKYYKNEIFNKESLKLIESRILKKKIGIKKFKLQKKPAYKHYNLFLDNLKKIHNSF